MSGFDRKRISSFLPLQSSLIDDSICIGRQAEHLSNKIEDDFAVTFFATRSREELYAISSMARDLHEAEMVIKFFKRLPSGSTTLLSTTEMTHFNFETPYKYSSSIAWDELRDIREVQIHVVFESL